MHELSIALSIIERAEEEVRRQDDSRVCAVHLRLGPLAGVVREALCFSYDVACQGTLLEGSRLVIEDVPVRVWCNNCAAEREPLSAQCLHCADCKSSRCRVVSGDELELKTLELEALHVTAETS